MSSHLAGAARVSTGTGAGGDLPGKVSSCWAPANSPVSSSPVVSASFLGGPHKVSQGPFAVPWLPGASTDRSWPDGPVAPATGAASFPGATRSAGPAAPATGAASFPVGTAPGVIASYLAGAIGVSTGPGARADLPYRVFSRRAPADSPVSSPPAVIPSFLGGPHKVSQGPFRSRSPGHPEPRQIARLPTGHGRRLVSGGHRTRRDYIIPGGGDWSLDGARGRGGIGHAVSNPPFLLASGIRGR